MEVLYERCAGMDISKTDAKVCVRIPSTRPGQYQHTVATYGATTKEVLRLRADLVAADIGLVVMEATGDYWKPFFFVLQESVNVQLVNAKQAKGVPGRKTDVSDARWLADLAAHGMLRACYVPEEPIRRLRDLARARKNLSQERTREYARLEKTLEDAGIKLSSVASHMTGLSVRRVLEAMLAGQRDPQVLTGLVHYSMKKKSAELVDALTGRFTEHHAFMVGMHLETIDYLDHAIAKIEEHLEEVMEPFRAARDSLTDIPGISITVANAIIAEIGPTMGAFATAGKLASWAGVCPGQNESAGRVKSAKTRPGNHYLKANLGIAVLAISHTKDNYLAAKYRRLCARRGKLKAVVAIEHALLVIIWNMLHDGVAYTELGPDYYTRINPEKVKNGAIRQLKNLGYDVALAPTAAA
jgi:Transposase and inactivated derivatives